LEIGGLVQVCYERLRTAVLAGAWEGTPDSARFARDGLIGLLPQERSTWTLEICQAVPLRWQGARDPHHVALRDVMFWLLDPRSVSAHAHEEVS
jgi:hypothetical protein